MQDYLEKPKKKKKKEEQNSKRKPRNFQIIDDDININELITTQESEILVDLLDPEGPSIVNDVIPEEKPKNDSTNKWIKLDFLDQENTDQEENSKNLFKKRTIKSVKTNDSDDLDEIPRKKYAQDSDLSPERQKINDIDDDDLDMIPRRHKSQEDMSPPRRTEKNFDTSNEDLDYVQRIKREKSPSERIKKVKQNSENDEIDETKVRVRKLTKEEETKKAKDAALKEKYSQWKMGLVQKKEKEEKIAEFLYESEKPLARYADDKDLDAMLKNQEREDDPMLAYLKKNNPEEKQVDGKPKNKYRGPPAPPNRYNILPGSKWDGVDRSNGFEKKYFESINAKKVFEQEAYKWSTEDM